MLSNSRVHAELAALWHPGPDGKQDELHFATLDSDLYIGVRLVLSRDGGLRVLRVDMQPDSRLPAEGEDEAWTDIPPHAVATLAFQLLREKYAGRFEAVDDLRSYCELHGIPYEPSIG